MAMLAILILPLMYLGWTAVAMLVPSAVAGMNNPGPHGFTETLYAYTSSTGNNGSAFAGLSANTFFYNLTLACAMLVPSAVSAMNNPGPHGFTEVLYAYTSQTGNNGSAFAGLSANTLFYNVTGAIAMGVGRFWMIIPTMAIAGSLAAKKTVPASAGTFPTTGGLFVGLVVGVIVIVGGLTFFPALALGPIVEQLAINAGTLFSSN